MLNSHELDNDMFASREPNYQSTPKLVSVSTVSDIPLVSVIVRSMDRPMLQDALDSIALQTYANVEVVVVNATGVNHSTLDKCCGRFPLRLVQGSGNLERSAAANLGMESAKGTYLIFLDDDDFFLANHLEKLCTALTTSTARACYTGVQLLGSEGQTILVLDEPWEIDRLRGANFSSHSRCSF